MQTFYATATGVANVLSFGSTLNINITCQNTTNVSSKLNSILVAMEKNGTVSSFYSQQTSQILVQAGSMPVYNIYQLTSNSIGTSAVCTSFSSSANIQLPSRMNFYIPSQRTSAIITIPAKLQSYSLPFRLTPKMGNTLNISVSALLEANGTIFGNVTVQTKA